MTIDKIKGEKVILILALFSTFSTFSQSISDLIFLSYQTPTLSYSFTETYYSSQSKLKSISTGTLFACKDKSITFLISQTRYNNKTEIIKNKQFFGCNDYQADYYENYKIDSSGTKKTNISNNNYQIYFQDSSLFTLFNNRKYKSNVSDFDSFIILELDNDKETIINSNLGEVTQKRDLRKYYISKSDYRIFKSFSYSWIDFFGLDIKDTITFTYQYLKLPDTLIKNKINNFIPLSKTKPLAKPQTNSYTDSITHFPLFNLPDTSLKSNTYKEIKSKFVLIEFWYKGCGPCLMNMKNLEKLKRDYKSEDLEIIAINTFDKIDNELKSFIKKQDTHFVFLFNGNELSKYLKINSFPTSYIYNNSTMKIIDKHIGGGPGYVDQITEILKNHILTTKSQN